MANDFFCVLSRHVGEYLQRKWGVTLGRITGLDPAEPHFEWADPVTRLDPTDAFFVDVIHTDGGPIMSAGAGMWQPCGHLDFYPNGGIMMRGCDRTIMGSLKQVSAKSAAKEHDSCNYLRACFFISALTFLSLDPTTLPTSLWFLNAT